MGLIWVGLPQKMDWRPVWTRSHILTTNVQYFIAWAILVKYIKTNLWYIKCCSSPTWVADTCAQGVNQSPIYIFWLRYFAVYVSEIHFNILDWYIAHAIRYWTLVVKLSWYRLFIFSRQEAEDNWIVPLYIILADPVQASLRISMKIHGTIHLHCTSLFCATAVAMSRIFPFKFYLANRCYYEGMQFSTTKIALIN